MTKYMTVTPMDSARVAAPVPMRDAWKERRKVGEEQEVTQKAKQNRA